MNVACLRVDLVARVVSLNIWAWFKVDCGDDIF